LLLVVATPESVPRVADGLRALKLPPASALGTRSHEVFVEYVGPDLEEVARLTGLSANEIVTRHSNREYTVAFLGFQPGFPYLAGLDPALAVPRRSTPRTEVPPGSIGIAGDVTGIYPRASPGGWRIIGRAGLVVSDVGSIQVDEHLLFDASSDPPARFAPGDKVWFLP
jgi:KipI family sensor histidine kinase inhibitor